jgi:hypothetical protein
MVDNLDTLDNYLSNVFTAIYPMTITISKREEHTPPPSNDVNISEIGDLFEFMNRDKLLMEIFIWFKESYEQKYILTKVQNKPNFKFGSCYSSTGMGKTSLLKAGMKKMIQNVQEKYIRMLDYPSEDDEYATELITRSQ